MPDMYNLPAALDLSRLLIFHSVLGCVTSVSFGSPSYNLPIALFGLFVSPVYTFIFHVLLYPAISSEGNSLDLD
jgi:hypothetical protein